MIRKLLAAVVVLCLLCCSLSATAASGFDSSELSYETADERDRLSNYMRDDKGLLLVNDNITSLFRSNLKLRSYFIELLTATVDYSLGCIETDGKLNAESMLTFLLTSSDLVSKMAEEPISAASLSDDELEVYRGTMNLLLNMALWASDTETWEGEKRSTFVEALSMYLEMVCIPISR